MTHKTVQKYILLHQQGQTNTRQSEAIQSHLKQCNECRMLAQQLENVYNAPDHLADIKAPSFLWTRIQANHARNQSVSKPVSSVLWRPVIATLLMVLALTVGLLLGDLPVVSTETISTEQSLRQSFYTDMIDAYAPPSMVEAVHRVYQQPGEAAQ